MDEKSLNYDLDALFLQFSLISSKIDVLTDMVLGIYADTFPVQTFEEIRLKFYTEMYQTIDERLKALEGVIDPAHLAKYKLNNLEAMNFLKKEKDV